MLHEENLIKLENERQNQKDLTENERNRNIQYDKREINKIRKDFELKMKQLNINEDKNKILKYQFLFYEHRLELKI